MIPIGNQILVKPFPSDESSIGGIIVPDSCKEVSNKVLIVKVGNGTKTTSMKLKEGDTAFRVKGWGTEVLINGELHFLLDQNTILAVEGSPNHKVKILQKKEVQNTYEVKKKSGKIMVNLV